MGLVLCCISGLHDSGFSVHVWEAQLLKSRHFLCSSSPLWSSISPPGKGKVEKAKASKYERLRNKRQVWIILDLFNDLKTVSHLVFGLMCVVLNAVCWSCSKVLPKIPPVLCCHHKSKVSPQEHWRSPHFGAEGGSRASPNITICLAHQNQSREYKWWLKRRFFW